jgi:hypothetical protein
VSGKIRIGWAATAALWLAATGQAAFWPSLLSPCGDRLFLAAVICVTIGAVAWSVAEAYLRPHVELQQAHETDLRTLSRFVGALGKRAGVTVTEDTGPLPVVRLEDRRRA